MRQFSDARKSLDKSKISVEKMPMASRKLASFGMSAIVMFSPMSMLTQHGAAQRSQTNIHQSQTTRVKA